MQPELDWHYWMARRLAVAMGVVVLGLSAPPQLGAVFTPAETRRLFADGLDHFYNLEYDYAISSFERLRDDDPTNPAWQNHVAFGYLYKQLLLAGALEGDLFGASNRF